MARKPITEEIRGKDRAIKVFDEFSLHGGWRLRGRCPLHYTLSYLERQIGGVFGGYFEAFKDGNFQYVRYKTELIDYILIGISKEHEVTRYRGVYKCEAISEAKLAELLRSRYGSMIGEKFHTPRAGHFEFEAYSN